MKRRESVIFALIAGTIVLFYLWIGFDELVIGKTDAHPTFGAIDTSSFFELVALFLWFSLVIKMRKDLNDRFVKLLIWIAVPTFFMLAFSIYVKMAIVLSTYGFFRGKAWLLTGIVCFALWKSSTFMLTRGLAKAS